MSRHSPDYFHAGLTSAVLLASLLNSSMLTAAPLGRFFTSPAERSRLEQIRHAPPVVQAEPVAPVVEPEPVVEKTPPPPPEVPGITINGLVKRSHGPSTAWVNGQSNLEGDLESQYLRVDRQAIGDSVRIDIPVTGDSVRLKPGQTYQPGEARIVDIEGNVAAEKAPPAPRR